MSQITSGLRKVLSIPSVYNLFQAFIGAKRGRQLFLERDLRVSPGTRVLDIGCGTAELLEYLPPDISYVGFDISSDYIKAAKAKFSLKNAVFYNCEFDSSKVDHEEKFDLVYCSGVLHHLEDNEVIKLFENVTSVLKPGSGRFVSADPCFKESQRTISKILVSMDRGQNIRLIEDLEKLAKSVFNSVNVTHRSDFLRLPYDHVVLECSNG